MTQRERKKMRYYFDAGIKTWVFLLHSENVIILNEIEIIFIYLLHRFEIIFKEKHIDNFIHFSETFLHRLELSRNAKHPIKVCTMIFQGKVCVLDECIFLLETYIFHPERINHFWHWSQKNYLNEYFSMPQSFKRVSKWLEKNAGNFNSIIDKLTHMSKRNKNLWRRK